MIRRHPGRILGVLVLLDVLLLLLSGPGKDDNDGVWYYLSTIGWLGFLLGALATVVLAAYVAVLAVMARRRGN